MASAAAIQAYRRLAFKPGGAAMSEPIIFTKQRGGAQWSQLQPRGSRAS
jgi:hypothetical protein